MAKNESYYLGLYEKAFPAGLGFEKMLEETRRLGFDQLELSIDESDCRLSRLDWNASQKKKLSDAVLMTGVPIKTMCLSAHRKFPLGSNDPSVRKRALDITKKAVDLAVETGISIIQLAGYDVYYEPSNEKTKEYFRENLKRSVEIAAEGKVILALETMETPFMDTVEKAMNFVQDTDSPWLKLYPDIGNLENAAVLYGHSSVFDLKKGDGNIAALHLKETAPGKYRDMSIGTYGHTRYSECIETAVRMGVRLFTGEFWYHDGQSFETEIKNTSVFLRKKLDNVFLNGNLQI